MRAEERIGHTIPPAYRAFLLAHNGGRVEPDGFPIYDEKGNLTNESVVDWFFGIGTGAYYNSLEDKLDTYHHRIPCDLFPIASDRGGNVVCISTSAANRGAVYFWQHEFEVDEPTYDNVFFVADNFDQFLKGLIDYGEGIARTS